MAVVCAVAGAAGGAGGWQPVGGLAVEQKGGHWGEGGAAVLRRRP